MTDTGNKSWTTRLANWLERPLSSKREHQDLIYKGVHGAALLGAGGWSVLAMAAALGWWALPYYAVCAATVHMSLHSHLKKKLNRITPLERAEVLPAHIVSGALPLSADISRTLINLSGNSTECRIGFENHNGYCQVASLDHKTHYLIMDSENIHNHHAQHVRNHGQVAGTAAFVRKHAAVIAHELEHMNMPKWYYACRSLGPGIAALLALPCAAVATTLGLMAAPTLAAIAYAGILTVGAVISTYLCHQMVSRTEEYRADRGAAERMGEGDSLAQILPAGPARLRQTFAQLAISHPSGRQRINALHAHASQLTALERANGAVLMAKVHSEVAARHPHMFKERPPEACPEGVLIRNRMQAGLH